MSRSPEDRLLAHLARPDYTPMRLEEIAKALGLDKRELRFIKHALPGMIGRGTVVRIKGDKLAPPSLVDLATGVIRFSAGGAARVFPEKPAGDAKPARGFSDEPVHIHAEDTGVALHGDTVTVRLQGSPRRAPGEARAGRVIRIVARAANLVPGTLLRERAVWYVAPDDPRFPRDILTPPPELAATSPKPTEGDKVTVRLAEWERRDLNPTGEIVEVLGRTHTPMAEYKAILRKYRLNPEFPPEVMAEVEALPDAVTPKDRAGRLDFRKVPTLTIDPDDAKDFDDAISLERLPEGALRVGVHIADVGAYVRPGTALDREARERGNSTYLVGTVVPMLPHALSNGVCSLVEAEDRLTKSVLVSFDRAGRVTATETANTVIRSRKRLTYRQALGLLTLDDLAAIRALPSPPPHQTGSPGRPLASLDDAELRSLVADVRALWRIAAKLREDRFRKGALDLEMTETKILCDAEGYAERAEAVEHDDSHRLVEEFMLLANEIVAKTLRDAGLPHLSRVHDEPDPEKLAELRQELQAMGVAVGDLTKRGEVVKLLKHIRELPNGLPLRIRFLRSLKQACYRAEADGHYGLAKRDYSHFTSPIRRYADLVEHRILDEHLARVGHPTAPRTRTPRPDRAELDRVADHISITERNSADAERESVKVKTVELFAREAEAPRKNVFEGAITDIRNHGFNVELAVSQAYGLVRLSSLEDDFYTLSADGRSVVGRRTRRTFSLGDKVRVTVERADRFRRLIDFRLAPENAPPPAPPSREKPDSGYKNARREKPGHPAKKTGRPADAPAKAPAKSGEIRKNARAEKPREAGRGAWSDAPAKPHHTEPRPASAGRLGVVSRGKRR